METSVSFYLDWIQDVIIFDAKINYHDILNNQRLTCCYVENFSRRLLYFYYINFSGKIIFTIFTIKYPRWFTKLFERFFYFLFRLFRCIRNKDLDMFVASSIWITRLQKLLKGEDPVWCLEGNARKFQIAFLANRFNQSR